MDKSVHMVIKGKVQGVWYRGSAKKKADELKISGFAKNLDDGNVEILAVGEERALRQLVDWCWQGPEQAKVTSIDVEWSFTSKKANGFKIL